MEEAWLKLESKLRSFILSKVQNEQLTDDLLQELFIRIHSSIDDLNDSTKIQSWIYQICRNLIIDHFRKNKKEHQKIQEFDTISDESGEEFMSDAIQDMLQIMNDLPSQYCEALCLVELEGISQKRYAERIGISYSGAKSRVQRAKKILRDALMKCCHYEFDKYGTVIDIHPVNCCCCP